jgi:hypothetical protein
VKGHSLPGLGHTCLHGRRKEAGCEFESLQRGDGGDAGTFRLQYLLLGPCQQRAMVVSNPDQECVGCLALIVRAHQHCNVRPKSARGWKKMKQVKRLDALGKKRHSERLHSKRNRL